jgi:hypothetical protein
MIGPRSSRRGRRRTRRPAHSRSSLRPCECRGRRCDLHWASTGANRRPWPARMSSRRRAERRRVDTITEHVPVGEANRSVRRERRGDVLHPIHPPGQLSRPASVKADAPDGRALPRNSAEPTMRLQIPAQGLREGDAPPIRRKDRSESASGPGKRANAGAVRDGDVDLPALRQQDLRQGARHAAERDQRSIGRPGWPGKRVGKRADPAPTARHLHRLPEGGIARRERDRVGAVGELEEGQPRTFGHFCAGGRNRCQRSQDRHRGQPSGPSPFSRQFGPPPGRARAAMPGQKGRRHRSSGKPSYGRCRPD